MLTTPDRTRDRALDRITSTLRRTTSRTIPVPPIALITGPGLELAAGDVNQPFFTASIDKVMIATLVAQLADDARLSLDSPIGDVLDPSDLSGLPAAPGVVNARDVTVRHLLSHTSGLPDVMLPPPGYTTTCAISRLTERPGHVWSVGKLLDQAVDLPPFARPGERFLYSDTAYLLLIRIIEHVGGRGFGEQLRDRILRPAGMADTAAWVGADRESLARLAPTLAPFWLGGPTTERTREFTPNLTWTTGIGGPSTAADLVRFQRALHDGELCDPAWVDVLGRARNRFRRGIHYGTGMVRLRFGEFLPHMREYPSPTGGLGYTATHLFYYPEQRTHVVLNYHAHRRMTASFRMHIRLAGLIRHYG